MKTLKNYIGQKFVDPINKKYFVKENPATGEPLLQVPSSDVADAELALKSAAQAYKEWSAVSLTDRCQKLAEIASAIETRFEDFVQVESEDTGKPVSLCRDLDIPRAIQNFRFFADFAQDSKNETFDMPQATSTTLRKPLGTVALITPWNLPIYLLTWKLAPALAMGNAVVAKPSELTPQSANLLAEVIESCGLPRGLVNIVHGPGATAAEALLKSPQVKAVSFTGGTQTGRRVSEAVAPSFKKLSLELGGKNPTLVFEDTDLKAAAAGVARSSFLNQGEICLCGERILIQKSIYADFLKLFVQETKRFKPGLPSLDETNFGALISKAHLEKIKSYVTLAKQEGGEILTGGKQPPELSTGFFFEPTIFDGLNPTCRTAQEEIFGPVVSTHAFENEAEAIAMANDVPYGLSASCWTNNHERIKRLGEQIEAGTIWVNTWLMRDLRVPFGGLKQSGLGREGGEYSLNFFSEIKTVCIKKDLP